jgi:hypothetical protein
MSIGTADSMREGARTTASQVTRAGSKLEARYVNFFQIGHNAAEFLLEFGQKQGPIHRRIYMAPQYAQILSDLLVDALKSRSEQFEPIVFRKEH